MNLSIIVAQLTPVAPTDGALDSLKNMINVFAGYILNAAIPFTCLCCLVFIIYNAIKMGTNADKPEEIKKNRSAIMVSLGVIIIVLLASVLVNMFVSIGTNIKQQTTPVTKPQ
jgi:hypothetical protein